VPEEQSGSSPSTHPRDGAIEFSNYSTTQLEDLKFAIDARAFPQNYARLCDELERRRTQNRDLVTRAPVCTGRLTTNDGLKGWVQAKRKRSPLYGSGSVDVDAETVTVHGWRRTWLGVGHRAELRIPLEHVRNVALQDGSLEFEYKRPYRRLRRIRVEAESAQRAQAVVDQLPRVQTSGFQQTWEEVREFNRRLEALRVRVWIAPSLVVANLLVFLALAIVSRRPGGFDPQTLFNWGANFGPFTVNGQWWRLVTALFLHLNALHVLLNVWALWNVGRLTERLYGNWTLLLLYFASGVLAGLTSVAWDPSRVTVGASGAIFGLFGSFLAFLACPGNRVPMQIVRAHWLSTLAFVAFNLISGLLQTGIDNAAHVGGLITGFVVGWVLVRPFGVDERRGFPLRQTLVAVSIVAALGFVGVWYVVGLGVQLTASENFYRDHAWYSSGEAANLRRWQQIAAQAGAGVISDAEVARQFEKDVVPFWKSADARLRAEEGQVPAEQREIAALVASFASLRLQWSTAIVTAARNPTPDAMKDLTRFVTEADQVQARVERIAILASVEHMPRTMVERWPLADVRYFLGGGGFTCAHAPAIFGPSVRSTDNATDGPAQRDQAGCLAQRLLASRRYSDLDSLITNAAASLGDLPDGSSTLDGIVVGLEDLLEFGSLDVQNLLGRTRDWRRAAPQSVYPNLMEALVFTNWAWAVRGHGFATEVTPQAWALFAHRTEMAAATLESVAAAASDTPVWYELSLDVGLDKSRDVNELREIFDAGHAKFPNHRPLYSRMLRILMPRWGGSYQKVNRFIFEASDINGVVDPEKYALLYWQYDSLERGDVDIFKDALAKWSIMKTGFSGLVDRFPTSDVIVNGFAKFACISGDSDEYRQLQPKVASRISSVVWTDKVSLESCNKSFRTVQ
jgi:membrane associated rhomboid family serine protease